MFEVVVHLTPHPMTASGLLSRRVRVPIARKYPTRCYPIVLVWAGCLPPPPPLQYENPANREGGGGWWRPPSVGLCTQLLLLGKSGFHFWGVSIENGQFFFITESMANDAFSEPPRRADSKNPMFILFFADFRVWVTSGGRESVSVGFSGRVNLAFWGGGLAPGLGGWLCGGAYWPLALEPSAMTSRHPHYCGHLHYCRHLHCRGHPPSWGGGTPECNFGGGASSQRAVSNPPSPAGVEGLSIPISVVSPPLSGLQDSVGGFCPDLPMAECRGFPLTAPVPTAGVCVLILMGNDVPEEAHLVNMLRHISVAHFDVTALASGYSRDVTGATRDALEGKGPQRWPQKPLDRRLEEVAPAVGGGCCRLQMPLKPALAVRKTVAGHGLGALEGGGVHPPLPMHFWVQPASEDVRAGPCR